MFVKNFTKIMDKKKLDIMLFYNLDAEKHNNTMYYFSGYRGIGCLVIHKKHSFLVVPEMEYERAKRGKLGVIKWEKGKRMFEAVAEIFSSKQLKVKRVGIPYRDFSLDVYKSLKKYLKKITVVDVEKEIFELRSIKSEEETLKIRKSCSILSNIMNECIGHWNFKTEKDVDKFLKIETLKNGCELAFPPIVASGIGGSMPHYEPQDIALRKGFCVIDFGVKHKGYCSDITRTIYIGKPSIEDKKLYYFLLNIQAAIIRKIKEGDSCSSTYIDTVRMLGKFAENFNHGLGHGIGLNIHELPNLKDMSNDIFRENMVFTVEPGIYFGNRFGIRIEDDIIIKKGKAEILTKVTKNLIVR